MKVVWQGKPVTIEAIRMPYDRAELHYIEAALYQEFEPEGENKNSNLKSPYIAHLEV